MKSPSTTRATSGDGVARAARLQLTVQAATWWVLAQGLVACLMNRWMADHLNLRYMDVMVPYIRQAGVAMLCLGLFLQASLRSARYQYLAVDVLILFLLGQAYFPLNFRLSGYDVNHLEWAGMGVNLGLGALLTAFRTRSSEMDPASAGTLFSLSVLEWGRRLTGQAPPKAMETPPPAAPPAKKPLVGGMDPLPTRTKSESLPHMD